jgi:hypothetical protein
LGIEQGESAEDIGLASLIDTDENPASVAEINGRRLDRPEIRYPNLMQPH